MHLLKVSSILLILVLLSCKDLAISRQEEVATLKYYKDPRTHLCFVHNSITSSNGFTYDQYSYVPCTPEVEQLIKEQANK